MIKTFEEFKEEILSQLPSRPHNWRKGQFVFNYIDAEYNIARHVQFTEKIDCFYNDDNIDDFIIASYRVLKEQHSDRLTKDEE